MRGNASLQRLQGTSKVAKPRTARQARRTLMFEPEGDRVIVGSKWLPTRIIADTKEQAIRAALEAWAVL